MSEINWNNYFISLKTHDDEFSVDWGWHKSKKMNPLPVLAAAKNTACVAVIGILESEHGTPDGLQVLEAEGEIKLSSCAGLASTNFPQKICQGGKEGLLFTLGTKQSIAG